MDARYPVPKSSVRPSCSRTCDWMLLIDRCCCPSKAELQGGAVNPLDACIEGVRLCAPAWLSVTPPCQESQDFQAVSISYPRVIRAALQASRVSQEHTLSLCESMQLFFSNALLLSNAAAVLGRCPSQGARAQSTHLQPQCPPVLVSAHIPEKSIKRGFY